MSVLVDAILAQDAAAALAALEQDPSEASATDPAGVSALLLARYRGLLEVVEAIRARRPIDVFEAAAVGDIERLSVLLADRWASTECWSPDGFTPLQLAAFFDHPGAAAVLLRAGADVSARATNPMGIQALHAAAASPTGSCVALVVAAGADVNETQQGAFTALHEAALRGDAAMAELLIAAGADRAARSAEGKVPADLVDAEKSPELAARLRR
jgi:uncharacterized protein